jgi:hypothetical protein
LGNSRRAFANSRNRTRSRKIGSEEAAPVKSKLLVIDHKRKVSERSAATGSLRRRRNNIIETVTKIAVLAKRKARTLAGALGLTMEITASPPAATARIVQAMR